MSDANNVVLGLQWGDEGKGKVIDLLSGAVDVVVRCQGGANAGHTVVVDGRKTILHLLPSGALHEGATCVIANGVVVDPLALCEELDDLGEAGEALAKRLLVSDRAQLVLPVHKALDAALEAARGDGKVGTTLRGIGPTYGDKITRAGIRAGVLKDPAAFKAALEKHLEHGNRLLRCWGADELKLEDVWATLEASVTRIAPMICDTVAWLHDAAKADKRMLFEGAQGVMLDIDFGTYPFVTSSNTGTGGIITGSGLSHKHLGNVIGIVKAYTTRVGEGPFPTELLDAHGDALRERGGEYGATTGRPRRCGWLDLVVVDYACKTNGVDTIALTKLDVLSGEETLEVCTGYKLNGEIVSEMPSEVSELAKAEPVYEQVPGWSEPIDGCRTFDELPQAAKDYVAFIEEKSGVKVGFIGVGPDREATIVR